jgi:hypothetical protein
VAGVIGSCVDVMPTHEQFIADHCAAAPIRGNSIPLQARRHS